MSGRVSGRSRRGTQVAARLETLPDIRRKSLMRLRRIEGQVRGLQRMVEEERGCAEVLAQVASVHGALRSAERQLVRSHLQNCVRNAVAGGDSERVEQVMAEVLDIVQRRES